MIRDMDNIETNITEFDKANQKLRACKQCVHFNGYKSCALFSHRFDTSYDILAHCGSCKANTKKPTAKKIKVRFF